MTWPEALRALSWSGVLPSARVGAASTATDRWQDKRAHIARRSVGCFVWIFWRVPHIVPLHRNVRIALNLLDFPPFSHIAGQRDGR